MTPHRHVLWARSPWRPVLALALLLSAWAPAARASLLTVSDTATFGAQSGSAATLSLDRFDPTLGTLVKVELQAGVLAEGIASLTLSCGPTNFGEPCPFVRTFGSLSISMPFSLGSLSLGLSGSDVGQISCSVPSGIRTTCVDQLDIAAQGTASTIDAATLDLFDDPGFVQLDFSKVASNLVTSTMSGSATITYMYDAAPIAQVPEPGTLGVACLALLALLGTARGSGRPRHGAARVPFESRGQIC